MSHAYTSYTTICCGNRKMAERIELIFTMETDSPELDGSPKDEGLSFLPSWGKVRCICLCLSKNVPMSIVVLTYLLTSPLFHPFVFIFCCLFSPAAVLKMCTVQTMEFISMLPCCPSAAVLLWYCGTSITKNNNYN